MVFGVFLNEKDIFRMINEAPNLHRACQNLVEAANAAGGPDNITVIFAQMIG
jgi:serine/threonine protein phosphatase PrpC